MHAGADRDAAARARPRPRAARDDPHRAGAGGAARGAAVPRDRARRGPRAPPQRVPRPVRLPARRLDHGAGHAAAERAAQGRRRAGWRSAASAGSRTSSPSRRRPSASCRRARRAPLFAARETRRRDPRAVDAARLGRRGAAQRLPERDRARPFAVDLRSERVRLAQSLLDGVRDRASRCPSCSATASSARCTSAGSTGSCSASGAISRLPELGRAQERLAFVTGDGRHRPVPVHHAGRGGDRPGATRRRRGSGSSAPATATAEDLAKRVESSVADGLELARAVPRGTRCRSPSSASRSARRRRRR